MAGVKAGAAVHARLMIRAIVEILIAEQSTPAFVARALPRFLAATVEATWVSNALITQWPLPTVVTSATARQNMAL